MYPSSDGGGTGGDINFDWSRVETSYWNIYESAQVQRACDMTPGCNGFVFKPASGEAVLKAGDMLPSYRQRFDNWCFYARPSSIKPPPPLVPPSPPPPLPVASPPPNTPVPSIPWPPLPPPRPPSPPSAAYNCIGWNGTCCNIPGYTLYPSSDGGGTGGDINFDWSLVGTSYWNIHESVQVQRACDMTPGCNGFVYKPASGEAVLKAGEIQTSYRLGLDYWCFYTRSSSIKPPPPSNNPAPSIPPPPSPPPPLAPLAPSQTSLPALGCVQLHRLEWHLLQHSRVHSLPRLRWRWHRRRHLL